MKEKIKNKILKCFNVNSITTKLTIGISTIVFVCTLTVGIIFLTQYRELSLKKVENEILQKSEHLSNFGELILNSPNNVPDPDFFNSLRRVIGSDFWVTDSNGKLIISTININKKYAEQLQIINKKYIDTIEKRNTITYDYSNYFEGKTLTIIVPIYQHSQISGTIMVHNDVNGIYSSNTYLTLLVFISLIISLFISIITGIIYSKKFTKPIKIITETTNKISKHDYNVKTNVKRNDEIGELAVAIDDMSTEISKNISEIKDLEKRAKDLVANVSHEFKTPLTIIKGYVENLNDNITKPNKTTYNKILNNTEVLEKLVNELLDLSKFEAGNVILNKENLDLEQLVKDVLYDLKNIADKKKIEIIFKCKIKSKQIINADYLKIRQLITIFLDNAIKYSNEMQSVIVTISKNKITIKDNGVGIEKKKMEQLFERYYQVDVNNKGYGLGLCIAKYIADAHGYKLNISSIENKGTVVEIVF